VAPASAPPTPGRPPAGPVSNDQAAPNPWLATTTGRAPLAGFPRHGRAPGVPPGRAGGSPGHDAGRDARRPRRVGPRLPTRLDPPVGNRRPIGPAPGARVAAGSRAPPRSCRSSAAGAVARPVPCTRLRARGPREPAAAGVAVEVRASRTRLPRERRCAPCLRPPTSGRTLARGAGTNALALRPGRGRAGLTCGNRQRVRRRGPCARWRRRSGSRGRPAAPHGGRQPCRWVDKSRRAAHPRFVPARGPLAGFARAVPRRGWKDHPCGPGAAGSASPSRAAYAGRVAPRNSRKERSRPRPDATRPPSSACRQNRPAARAPPGYCTRTIGVRGDQGR
jgi:hypothetical protein